MPAVNYGTAFNKGGRGGKEEEKETNLARNFYELKTICVHIVLGVFCK